MLYMKASPSTRSSARLRIIGSIRLPEESWTLWNACELRFPPLFIYILFVSIRLVTPCGLPPPPSLFGCLTYRLRGNFRVSLLTNFEDASSYLDWTIGVHGIYITFPHPALLIASHSESSSPSPLSSSTTLLSSNTTTTTKPTSSAAYKKTFSATYLPEVVPAQGWDKIEAVNSAIHKAGWSGRITEEIRRSVKLRRYQSKACTVTWHEFVEWREANGGKM